MISLEDLIYYSGGFLLTFGGNFIHENHIYALKKIVECIQHGNLNICCEELELFFLIYDDFCDLQRHIPPQPQNFTENNQSHILRCR